MPKLSKCEFVTLHKSAIDNGFCSGPLYQYGIMGYQHFQLPRT